MEYSFFYRWCWQSGSFHWSFLLCFISAMWPSRAHFSQPQQRRSRQADGSVSWFVPSTLSSCFSGTLSTSQPTVSNLLTAWDINNYESPAFVSFSALAQHHMYSHITLWANLNWKCCLGSFCNCSDAPLGRAPAAHWNSHRVSHRVVWDTKYVCRFWGSKKKSDYFTEKAPNLSRLLQVRAADGQAKTEDPNNSVKTPLIMVNGQTPVARIPGHFSSHT